MRSTFALDIFWGAATGAKLRPAWSSPLPRVLLHEVKQSVGQNASVTVAQNCATPDRAKVARGRAIIPANKRHLELEPTVIGGAG